PIVARAPQAPDPLQSLATPTASNGVTNTFPAYLGNNTWGTATTPQSISLSNADNVTGANSIPPGIYQSIKITGGSANFSPGIYVLGINQNGNGGNALDINGGTITGSGVLFYNTGGSYTLPNGQGTWDPNGWNPTNGGADASDAGTTPPKKPPVNFGG